jgi:hypothetical protein
MPFKTYAYADIWKDRKGRIGVCPVTKEKIGKCKMGVTVSYG